MAKGFARIRKGPRLAKNLDKATIDAARAGDLRALNALLECSRQDLRRYAEFHCEVNDVEDAVQESLFAASTRLGDLRQAEALVSWLFRIVKRECNRMRRGWRMLTNQEIDERIMPLAMPDGQQLRLDISKAMGELPEHYREILLLRDVEGRSLDELAGILSLDLAAAKSRLHRARAVMRDKLDIPSRGRV